MITKKRKVRVALGMSGGVDSSLCAHLLVEQGYDVTGVYLECWRAPGCRTEEDRKDALKVALELGIPFQVLDFKQAYKDRVVEYFFKEYEAGRTPNPDVMCNKEIKFGLFYDWALRPAQGEPGFDYVATGHYANVATLPRSSVATLVTARDSHKDQTYFLYRLREEQLEHILFPIGHLTKPQVRAEAKKRAIPVADKPDSQGICFIGEINVHNFLKERLGENPGEVVNPAGEVIGTHKGLWFYTVGQRHGFEISGTWMSKLGELKHAMPPYYVIKKNPDKNQLVVGFGAETYRDEFVVEDVHIINDQFSIFNLQNSEKLSNQSTKQLTNQLFVRIRHGGELLAVASLSAKVDIKEQGKSLSITLVDPVKGLAEGQSAVFYLKADPTDKNADFADINPQPSYQLPTTSYYHCLGGGIISG